MSTSSSSPSRGQRRSQIPVMSGGTNQEVVGGRSPQPCSPTHSAGQLARPRAALSPGRAVALSPSQRSPAGRYASTAAAHDPPVDYEDGDTSSLYELSSISGDDDDGGFRDLDGHSAGAHQPLVASLGPTARVYTSPMRGGLSRDDVEGVSPTETTASSASASAHHGSPRRPGTLAKYVQRFRHAPALSREARGKLSASQQQRVESKGPDFWWLNSASSSARETAGAGPAVEERHSDAELSPRRLAPAPSGATSPEHPARHDGSPASLAVSDDSSEVSSSRRGVNGSQARPYPPSFGPSSGGETDAASIIASKLQDTSLPAPSASALEQRVNELIALSESLRTATSRADHAGQQSGGGVHQAYRTLPYDAAASSPPPLRAYPTRSPGRRAPDAPTVADDDVLMRWRRDRIKSDVEAAVAAPTTRGGGGRAASAETRGGQATTRTTYLEDSESTVEETDAETRLGDRLRMWVKPPADSPGAVRQVVLARDVPKPPPSPNRPAATSRGCLAPEPGVDAPPHTTDPPRRRPPPPDYPAARVLRCQAATQTDPLVLPLAVIDTGEITRTHAAVPVAPVCDASVGPDPAWLLRPTSHTIPEVIESHEDTATERDAAHSELHGNTDTPITPSTIETCTAEPDRDSLHRTPTDAPPEDAWDWEQDGVLVALRRRAQAIQTELQWVELELENKPWR